jgi:hypothetical protein
MVSGEIKPQAPFTRLNTFCGVGLKPFLMALTTGDHLSLAAEI